MTTNQRDYVASERAIADAIAAAAPRPAETTVEVHYEFREPVRLAGELADRLAHSVTVARRRDLRTGEVTVRVRGVVSHVKADGTVNFARRFETTYLPVELAERLPNP